MISLKGYEMRANYLIVGPPGSGKIRTARQLAGFHGRLIWSARQYVYRACGLSTPADTTPSFRAPHHTCSVTALKGTISQGYQFRPGECSLAHGGTLFLDELPEFSARAIEAVLHAWRSEEVTITGERGTKVIAPTSFQLIGTMLPCPCGWYGSVEQDAARRCACSESARVKYQKLVPAVIREHCEVIDLSSDKKAS